MKRLLKIIFIVKVSLIILGAWIRSIFCDNENGVKMHWHEGELVVLGSNEAEIVLLQEPRLVEVEFEENQILVPCDPHHHHHDHHHGHHRDRLFWYIKHYHRHFKHKNNYVLKIEWVVKTARTIKWKVYF